MKETMLRRPRWVTIVATAAGYPRPRGALAPAGTVSSRLSGNHLPEVPPPPVNISNLGQCCHFTAVEAKAQRRRVCAQDPNPAASLPELGPFFISIPSCLPGPGRSKEMESCWGMSHM